MIFENKRKNLNKIIREALNGRKDPWEDYTPNLFRNKERARVYGYESQYKYGLGDFVTQKITIGKVAAGATLTYGISVCDGAIICSTPFAYGAGRLADGVVFLTKMMYLLSRADKEHEKRYERKNEE